MFDWSLNPQDICWRKCLRTVFTWGNFLAKASSSDPQMRLDIVVFAEDSEVTDLARSTTSSAHSRGGLLELRLLVPTLIIIWSGFLRKSGLIRSFMSCVVHPGNVAISTSKFLDLLWFWRYFSVESPAMIIFFRQLRCGWSRSFVTDSVQIARSTLSEGRRRRCLLVIVAAICFLIGNISHFLFYNISQRLETVSSFSGISGHCFLTAFCLSIFTSRLIHLDPTFSWPWLIVISFTLFLHNDG